jgi:hypothetical protein
MSRLILYALVICTMVIAGCGGGNNGAGGLNGAVTVTGSQLASNFSSDVTFTITYTNPLKTDLIGVPINYSVLVDGTLIDQQATNFNNSGILLVTYHIPKGVAEKSVRCVANSANLIGSTTVTVAAFGALNVTPSIQTFADTDLVGTVKTYTISGGSGNYSVASSDETLVTALVSGTTVNATRAGTGAGTVNLTVTDTTTLESVVVQATLVAIPPAP